MTKTSVLSWLSCRNVQLRIMVITVEVGAVSPDDVPKWNVGFRLAGVKQCVV